MHPSSTAALPPATAFLRRVSRRKSRLESPADSITEYIERRALRLTERELDELRQAIPALRTQLADMAAACEQCPNLPGQLTLLANLLEDAAAGDFGPISDALRREASFALFYLADEADIIPDCVPEIGYADDSFIVRSVLSRHLDVLTEYCAQRPNPANNLSLEA